MESVEKEAGTGREQLSPKESGMSPKQDVE